MSLYIENQEVTKYLTQEQVRALFAQIHTKRDLAMFNVAYKYGLRASEIGLLRMQEVMWERNRIKIWRVKGGISREYLLFPDTSSLLLQYLTGLNKSPETPLFLSRNKNPISRKTVHWQFRKYAKAANLPPDLCHEHTLRHSIGVHMMDAGHSREEVQFLLGHRNIQNTERYTAISGRKQRKIFEQMELAKEIVKVAI